jgi:uncharacterized membrane protein YkvI
LGFSQLGFSNIVAYIYPLEGYLGFVFLLLMVCNYVKINIGKKQMTDQPEADGHSPLFG